MMTNVRYEWFLVTWVKRSGVVRFLICLSSYVVIAWVVVVVFCLLRLMISMVFFVAFVLGVVGWNVF